MTRYLIKPRDSINIFLKGYGSLSVAKNIVKNIGKSRSKNLSNKYIQKPLEHVKQYAINALETA